jgi:hypothetical protein
MVLPPTEVPREKKNVVVVQIAQPLAGSRGDSQALYKMALGAIKEAVQTNETRAVGYGLCF